LWAVFGVVQGKIKNKKSKIKYTDQKSIMNRPRIRNCPFPIIFDICYFIFDIELESSAQKFVFQRADFYKYSRKTRESFANRR